MYRNQKSMGYDIMLMYFKLKIKIFPTYSALAKWCSKHNLHDSKGGKWTLKKVNFR